MRRLLILILITGLMVVALAISKSEAHRRYHYAQPSQAELNKRCLTKSICTNTSAAEIIYEQNHSGRKVWTERTKSPKLRLLELGYTK